MKSKSELIIIFVIIIIISIIIFAIFSIITKVEVREFFNLPKYSRESYLDVKFTYSDFHNSTNKYSFVFYIQNKFQHDLAIDINSQLKIIGKSKEIIIDEENIKDILGTNVNKKYDVEFEGIFDDSKINGLNFCEDENTTLGCKYECCKGDVIDNGICWEDCRIYRISEFLGRKNLYCQASPRIITTINYSAIIKDVIEISKNSRDERIKWNIKNSPLNIYLRPSPLPFNNLLPLDISFEIEGEKVFVKNIKVEVLNYSIEIETFFEKRRESIEINQKCEIDVNKLIDGKIYLGKEKSCRLGPFEIKVEKILKDRVETNYMSREEINRTLQNICKNYITNESIDYENCAKELNKRGYGICSLFSNLEICKVGEEKLNKIFLLITVEIEKKEEFQKRLIPQFC